MSTVAAVEYLSKLLNRPVDAGTILRLSSAQRARFNAWLHTQGIKEQDALLIGEFSLDALLSGVARDTGTPSVPPVQSAATESVPATPFALGVDIQRIDELLANVNVTDLKADSELAALFTARELSYAQARPGPLDTLAGLYAAKEAVRKCIGGRPLTPEAFRSLEILPDDNGKPCAAGFELSISHSGGFAVAIACRFNSVPAPAGPGASAMPDRVPKSSMAAASSGVRVLEVALTILIAVSVCVQLVLLFRFVPWRW
jgi:phosphopantetheine--protein transferase-like protein